MLCIYAFIFHVLFHFKKLKEINVALYKKCRFFAFFVVFLEWQRGVQKNFWSVLERRDDLDY